MSAVRDGHDERTLEPGSGVMAVQTVHSNGDWLFHCCKEDDVLMQVPHGCLLMQSACWTCCHCRFETTLMLRPGAYRVKFLVDDEWRHAGDWPTEVDSHGNVVNVLTVA